MLRFLCSLCFLLFKCDYFSLATQLYFFFEQEVTEETERKPK
jgi:hypothetical protein